MRNNRTDWAVIESIVASYYLIITATVHAPSRIRSTEAECSLSIETKPTLYLQATTAGPIKYLNILFF